jgi:hypothetical protein
LRFIAIRRIPSNTDCACDHSIQMDQHSARDGDQDTSDGVVHVGDEVRPLDRLLAEHSGIHAHNQCTPHFANSDVAPPNRRAVFGHQSLHG